MSWCGSACDWVEDNIVDPVDEAVDTTVDWVDENIVDPIEDVIEETYDFASELGEDFLDGVEEFAEKIAEVAGEIQERIETAWDDMTTAVGDVLSRLWEGIENAWNGLVHTLEEWGEWLKEQVDSAVDWLLSSAEAVLKWFLDDLVPWVVSLLRLPWVLAKVLGGLLALGTCWIVSKFTQPEEVKVIKALTDHHPRFLEEFRLERRPVEHKYVVFSDIHLFVNGDFNFYRNNRNGDLHRWLLAKYAADGYHLIENGDIEDFWMRGGSIRGHILDVADVLPWPFHYEAYSNQAAWSAMQAHAVNIFMDNAETYALVDSLYVAKDRYARTVGNHDDAWDGEEMLPLFGLVYRNPVVANDYVLLDNSTTGETEVIIAHGHQSDIWNMRLCDYAGKLVTEGFSVLTEASMGLISKAKKFYVTREEWNAELSDMGFDNELHTMEGLGLKQSLDEVELYKNIEEIYGNSPRQPYLILGHTHNVKDDAGVPDYMYRDDWNWKEYSNSGTTGMWEEMVTCLEMDYPDITPIAWYFSQDGTVQREVLASYRYGDVYLK